MDRIYHSEEELLEVIEGALKIPFNKFENVSRLISKKGGVGQFVEEEIFKRECNSLSEPDINELGIEIKTTPFIYKKNGEVKAKERLVLGIINYNDENLKDFYKSHFWEKNQKLLIAFYYHNSLVEKTDWYLDSYILYKWPIEDLAIVINDWKTIVKKIAEGKAHELSEGDTLYLGACTKGATSESSYRSQPFSSIPAKQRAYCLKQKYMTTLLEDYVYGNKTNERIITNVNDLEGRTLKDYIVDKFNNYVGRSQKELIDLLKVPKSKQINNSIVKRIFNLNNNIDDTDEFKKAGIKTKTVRINHDDSVTESMSFPSFKFMDIIDQENFYDSDIYDMFANTIFMFIYFKKTHKGDTDTDMIFEGVNIWSMPEKDLEEVAKVYDNLRKTLIEGVELIKTPYGDKYRIENNLPKKDENQISHIRPHTSNARYKFDDIDIGKNTDGDTLPDGRIMTKQSFWLNNDYIKNIYIEWKNKKTI